MNSDRHRSDTCLLAILLVFAILASTVTTASLALDFKTRPSSPLPASSSDVKIWLNGDAVGAHPGWNDTSPGPTISVFSGETVNMSLNATDTLLHNWFIDTNNNGVPEPNEISSPDFSVSTTKVLSFSFTPVIGQNIPSAGNWTYRCRYHPVPYMYGTIRVVQPDFSLSASPSLIKVGVGSVGASTMTINPVSHFNETVNLIVTSTNGLTAQISPGSISSISGTATLTAIASSAGNYTATVTGKSGSLTHSLTVMVEAGDFSIIADSAVSSTEVNALANSAITVTAANHFAGVVDLTSNSTLCSLNPTSLTGAGESTLSCIFTSPRLNHVQVTGVNDSLSHSVMIIFNVTAPKLADFIISTASSTASLKQGSHSDDAILLNSIEFSGTISLSVTIGRTSLHHGPRARLGNSSVALSANNASSTVLRLSAHGSTTPGNYVVTVTATSGSLIRSVTIIMIVTSRH